MNIFYIFIYMSIAMYPMFPLLICHSGKYPKCILYLLFIVISIIIISIMQELFHILFFFSMYKYYIIIFMEASNAQALQINKSTDYIYKKKLFKTLSFIIYLIYYNIFKYYQNS